LFQIKKHILVFSLLFDHYKFSFRSLPSAGVPFHLGELCWRHKRTTSVSNFYTIPWLRTITCIDQWSNKMTHM